MKHRLYLNGPIFYFKRIIWSSLWVTNIYVFLIIFLYNLHCFKFRMKTSDTIIIAIVNIKFLNRFPLVFKNFFNQFNPLISNVLNIVIIQDIRISVI